MSLDSSTGDSFLDWYHAGMASPAPDPFAPVVPPPVETPAPAVPQLDANGIDPSLIEIDPPPPMPTIGFPRVPASPVDPYANPAVPGAAPAPIPPPTSADLEQPTDPLAVQTNPNAPGLFGQFIPQPVPDKVPDGTLGLPPEYAYDRISDVPEKNLRDALFAANPQALAQEHFDAEQKRKEIRDAALAKADEEAGQARIDNANRLRKSLDVAAAKRVQNEADAVKLASEGQGWDSFDTTQKVAGGIAAVLGGLTMHLNGGRNIGVEMVNQAIEESLAKRKNQQAELARRGAAIGEEMSAARDTYANDETLRVAAYEQAARMAERQAANYDPRGTAARASAEFAMTMRAQAKQALDAKQEHDQKNAAAALKAQDDHLKTQAEIVKLNAEAGKMKAAAGPAEVHPPQYFGSLGLDVPPNPMTDVQYDKWQSRKGKTVEQQGKTVENQVKSLDASAPERARKFGVAGLQQKDGTAFLARNENIAASLANKKHVASEINDIINEVLDIRDKVGGESSWGNSDARQRLEVLQNRLIVLTKSGTEGMSSDEDMNKLAATLGAADVGSFRARAAGLKEGRDRTTAALNSELRANGYDGPLAKFPNRFAGGERTRAPEEETFKKTLGWDTNQYAYGKTLDVAKTYGTPFPEQDVRGYSGEQERTALALAATAHDESKTPEAREAARTQLDLISKKADSPGFRAFAAKLLGTATTEPGAPRYQ